MEYGYVPRVRNKRFLPIVFYSFTDFCDIYRYLKEKYAYFSFKYEENTIIIDIYHILCKTIAAI